MKSQILLFSITLIFFSLFCNAQNPVSGYDKIDAQLKYWISEPQVLNKEQPSFFKNGPLSDPLVPLVFKSYSSNIAALLSKHGGILHSEIGVIYTAMIPLSKVIAFASEQDIVKIESSQKVRVCNDKGRQLIGADRVNAGQLPGGTAYTGKGVIVGVFDTGIDFTHPDFRKKNDTSQTRILSIWDQTVNSGTAPANFNYGSEWNNSQINTALTNPNSISETDNHGHGTHVTGTAAGLRGIAYDAEIIFVKGLLDWDSDSTLVQDTKALLDGFNYIYQKSVALGKPCVVNLSVGYNLGSPHNGKSLVEQGFDYLVNSKPGFMICVAVGNENGRQGHFGGINLGADSIWTYAPGTRQSVLYGVFDSKNEDSIFISIITDSASFNTVDEDSFIIQKKIFQTPWLKLKNIRNSTSGITYLVKFSDNTYAASLNITASAFDSNTTEIYIKINNLMPSYLFNKVTLFKISLKGQGVFHSWWENYQVTTWDNPYWWSNREMNARHIFPDNNYMTNVLACGKKTISVGAFVNRTNFKNIVNKTLWGPNYSRDSSGAFAHFSSLGPTTDGRNKPDFSAPGLNVASSHSRNAPLDSNSQIDLFTTVMSGTSMATPMATGAIALYLERSPNATFDEIRNAVISSVNKDTLTSTFGALPNNHWGYGRLNIFRAMAGPNTGIAEQIMLKTNSGLSVFPNPASKHITFTLTQKTGNEILSVYDICGKSLLIIPLTDASNHIDVSNWRNGIYFYRISGSVNTYSGKFMVE